MTGKYFIALKTKDGGQRTYPLGPKHYGAVRELCERLQVTPEALVTMCVGPVVDTLTEDHAGREETFTMDRHTSRCLRYGAKLSGHDLGAYMWQHLVIQRAGKWAARRDLYKSVEKPRRAARKAS